MMYIAYTFTAYSHTPTHIHRGPDIDIDTDGGGDNGSGERGGGRGERRPPGESSVMKKTAQQIAGEQVLERMVQAVDGLAFSFK